MEVGRRVVGSRWVAFVMVTRRFAPWRLYTSAELYESTGENARTQFYHPVLSD